MNEYLLEASPRPLVIGATGRDEIEQNIRVIVSTFGFDVCLDCAFADNGAYIDAPLPHAAALRIATLTEAVEKYEQRVNILSLTFAPDPEAAMQGKAYPTLRYAIKEGAL